MNNHGPLEFIAQELDRPEPPLRKIADFVRPDNGNRVVVWNSDTYDPLTQVHNEDRIFEEIDGDGNVLSKHIYGSLIFRDIDRRGAASGRRLHVRPDNGSASLSEELGHV